MRVDPSFDLGDVRAGTIIVYMRIFDATGPRRFSIVAAGFAEDNAFGTRSTCEVDFWWWTSKGGAYALGAARQAAISLASVVVGRWLWDVHKVAPSAPIAPGWGNLAGLI